MHPRRDWGGSGLLGVVARYDYFFPTTTADSAAYDRILSVQEVAAGSEAERAGLRAGEDFLLGTDEASLTHCRDLVLHLWDQSPRLPVEYDEDKNPVILMTYNSRADAVRPVVLRLGSAELVRPSIPSGAAEPAEEMWLWGARLVSGPRSMARASGGRFTFPRDSQSEPGSIACASHPAEERGGGGRDWDIPSFLVSSCSVPLEPPPRSAGAAAGAAGRAVEEPAGGGG